MTEQLKHIYNLICTIYPMDYLDKQAHEEAKALLVEIIAREANK